MNPELQQFNQIADGLADQSFAVIDGFLSDDEVKAILHTDAFRDRKLHFKKAGIGKLHEKQINESIRGDYIHWIDPSTSEIAIQVYFQKLKRLISFVNENLFLSLKDAEIHLTVYPEGAFYKRHLDQFKQDDHRKLSIICYLNHDWQNDHGGQLRMHLPDGPLDILPSSGRLVCFRSDQVEHEVLPANRERLSLTGWLTDTVI
jgi:SM-20-related protein